MAEVKFNIVTYIKPNHDVHTFTRNLKKALELKHLDKMYISFKEKLSTDFKEQLVKHDNIIWKDNVDNYWATEMRDIISQNPSKYYYIWEEDSHIFNVSKFDKAYEKLLSTDVDFLFTQDLKWIKRSQHLADANLVLNDNNFTFFYWGSRYAEHCRKTSTDPMVKGAYPVTLAGIFTSSLLIELLDKFLQSSHWKEITSGNFSHFHDNPKLPHSFEVFPEFWWEDKGGPGTLEYKAMICNEQFAEEVGERLVTTL